MSRKSPVAPLSISPQQGAVLLYWLERGAPTMETPLYQRLTPHEQDTCQVASDLLALRQVQPCTTRLGHLLQHMGDMRSFCLFLLENPTLCADHTWVFRVFSVDVLKIALTQALIQAELNRQLIAGPPIPTRVQQCLTHLTLAYTAYQLDRRMLLPNLWESFRAAGCMTSRPGNLWGEPLPVFEWNGWLGWLKLRCLGSPLYRPAVDTRADVSRWCGLRDTPPDLWQTSLLDNAKTDVNQILLACCPKREA